MPPLILKENCNSCTLANQRKTIVWGQGTIEKPKLFIIGEAPGREEDLLGQPFIGGAGRILSALLQNANINRNSCYITNICKCRPPNNRVPSEEEQALCLPFLEKEISFVNPDILVCLGDTASKAITGYPCGLYRGMIVPSKEAFGRRKTLITYHPIFLMRSRNFFSTVSWDLSKPFLSIPSPEENYHINPPFHIIKHFFDEALLEPFCSCDIETSGGDKEESEKGLNPFADQIIGIGFCAIPGKALNLSGVTMHQNWRLIKWFLETHKGISIQTKGTFDNTFLNLKGIALKHSWNTATGMYILYSDSQSIGGMKLEYIRSVYTNLPPYKHIYKNPQKLDTINLGRYNCLDADIQLRATLAQQTYVPKSLMSMMIASEHTAMNMRIRGVLVDKYAIASHYALLIPAIEKYESLFQDAYETSISSNKQLSSFIYNTLGFKPSARAQKGKTFYSVDEEELTDLSRRCNPDSPSGKILSQILDYRGKCKIAQTYCEGIFKLIQADGRVHPDWIPQGTDTGRWACKQPNLQNIPKEMRNCFIASEGNILFGSDFSQLEIWVGALLANAKDMLAVLNSGVRIHTIVGDEIRKYDPNIPEIKVKAVVFGGIYGRKPASTAREFGLPTKTVEIWYNIFYTKFPEFISFMQENIAKWERQGYLENFFGFKKYCESELEALNFPIQGTAGRIAVLASTALEKEGFHPIINVHDQIICEEPDLGQEENEKRFAQMQNIMGTCCPSLHPYFPSKGGIGKSWNLV